ncbi:Sister chromatid cohesion protein DCC1 [Lunasporangiospora selenospora]|uniref:Sister chromatid cohesion protein DCC1 n=1 Tax=Lunasporangiospora selenospora TaxID=979761 RepID=A0A9P6KDM3_9FUNG|nr:Sister chromatid cohesion protein DCC1 [Lunasporangiospora selenospora]
MANPSTQPPSNALTTDIVFSNDFVQSSYLLLEIPKDLDSLFPGSDDSDAMSFQVRGIEKDTAVICTPTQTFSLQRAYTSNMLIPIAPIIEQQDAHNMDTNSGLMDLDQHSEEDPFPPRTHSISGDQPYYDRQAVVDILDNTLNLISTTPRLERLSDLLGRSQFEGHWRLFKRRFMYDILQEILLTLNILEMSVDSIQTQIVCEKIGEDMAESDLGIEGWMIEHCLNSFSVIEPESKPESQKAKVRLCRLSAEKICTFMGVHLLATIERGNRWKLEEFLYRWEESLRGHYQADLSFLAGECIVEAERVAERNQTQKYIRYLSKSQLPNDPTSRFTALFEIKSKWGGQEIRPFLRDLVSGEKQLDVLLLKHARSVKQPGGVIYSSRIIK